MRIKNITKEVLENQRATQYKLAQGLVALGLYKTQQSAITAVYRFCNQKCGSIKYELFCGICEVLNVEPGDLLKVER